MSLFINSIQNKRFIKGVILRNNMAKGIYEIKLSIEYQKSDFEEKLEGILKDNGFRLNKPFQINRKRIPDYIIRKSNSLRKLNVDYRRSWNAWGSLNRGLNDINPIQTDETILLKFDGEKKGYRFRLNYDDLFLLNLYPYAYNPNNDPIIKKIAPDYRGILKDRKDSRKMPEITKEKFLSELDKVLKEYASNHQKVGVKKNDSETRNFKQD